MKEWMMNKSINLSNSLGAAGGSNSINCVPVGRKSSPPDRASRAEPAGCLIISFVAA